MRLKHLMGWKARGQASLSPGLFCLFHEKVRDFTENRYKENVTKDKKMKAWKVR